MGGQPVRGKATLCVEVHSMFGQLVPEEKSRMLCQNQAFHSARESIQHGLYQTSHDTVKGAYRVCRPHRPRLSHCTHLVPEQPASVPDVAS